MSEGKAPTIRAEFSDFMEKFAEQLNEAFMHTYRRFDDIENRLNTVNQKINMMERKAGKAGSYIHTVKNDT